MVLLAASFMLNAPAVCAVQAALPTAKWKHVKWGHPRGAKLDTKKVSEIAQASLEKYKIDSKNYKLAGFMFAANTKQWFVVFDRIDKFFFGSSFAILVNDSNGETEFQSGM